MCRDNDIGAGNERSYWAKGTGFGTGSTSSGWDVEQAMLKQKAEEEHVTCLLQVTAVELATRDLDTNHLLKLMSRCDYSYRRGFPLNGLLIYCWSP